MKKNVGQLGFRGLFVGIVVLLAIGIIVYGRFNFEQKAPPQDAATTRLNDLEKKSIETQTKLDQVQETLNQVRSKTAQSGAPKSESKKHH